ncbi:dehydrogenase [Cohnella thailandensis]|uniref:Dehydrogenase n=1 Tax=Cohnella thailandensis TaxID=557557 RepID=A0A841T4C9_9BACL|nr:dehydrogenase [Cohnella thailandensis]MBB6638482.1 dehydrogenase [Cohnella thailandensis]MBP1977458.1 toxin CptA [Cohnella thailandensis]
MRAGQPKHQAPLPSARTIRRACSNELYRTVKRLRLYVPEEKIRQAEELYVKRVIGNLIWITENRSDRRKLADWWDAEVSEAVAELWEVDLAKLQAAFRASFGG